MNIKVTLDEVREVIIIIIVNEPERARGGAWARPAPARRARSYQNITLYVFLSVVIQNVYSVCIWH